jgi:hypothetical protein
MPTLTADEVSTFRDVASALLAARERLELAKQQAAKPQLCQGVEIAGRRALQVVGRICTKGRGITALRFRGQVLFPAAPARWVD